MKSLVLFLTLFLFSVESKAQLSAFGAMAHSNNYKMLSATNPYWQWLGPPDSEEVDNIYGSGDTIFAGGIAHLYRSFDGGKSWSIIDSVIGNPKPDTVLNCYGCPGPDSIIYPPGSGQVVSLSISANNPTLIYEVKGRGPYYIAGGAFKSTDGGKSWKLISDPSDTVSYPYPNSGIKWVSISPFDPNLVFAIRTTGALYIDGLYRSSDGGTTWSYVSSSFPFSDHGLTIQFAFDPSDSMKMYATGDDHLSNCLFYASTDQGLTWTSRSECPGTLGFFKTDTSWDILGWGGPQVISSTDGGYTWNGPIHAGYHNFNVDYMQYVPTIPQIFYAACDYYDSLNGPDYAGIYRSIDSLKSWTLLNGSESLPISAFAYDSNLKVNIDGNSGFLYVCSTKGLYKYYQPVTEIQTVSASPSQFRLYPNYPNPFNPSTVIRYDLPKRSRVVVEVYNVLGQLVETLLDQNQEAGTREVRFDGTRFSSGVYFYRILAGNTSLGGKMLLLK